MKRRYGSWWPAVSFAVILVGLNAVPAALMDPPPQQPWTELFIGTFLIALLLNGLLITCVGRWQNWQWKRGFRREMHGPPPPKAPLS